ncbi:phosphotransferase [Streptomyces sp. ML-6]|uniref:phosphotransferase family protein n=1 Tax=Streptomyces sp. ML-6 TaxID=2982693 RepID=UPI0024BFF655|nr:phosphotransferase [Streptomyces sp. ML-6]MDK0520152.1 phosphotransferase [Streptomyces sp. ML-6]
MGETADDWPDRATCAWVGKQLAPGERIESVRRLRGGWTSWMRRLDISGPGGGRSLVLRSFVKPFYVRHAPGLLTREADVLRLLAGTGVPAARPVAVDAVGEHCDHPSLLMTLLPGEVRVDDAGAAERAGLLAGQLAAVHRVEVTDRTRPRDYEAWTAPDRVRVPEDTGRPLLWRRAIEVIRREPPAYEPCFLHRDFHPGNVLFTGRGEGLAGREEGLAGRGEEPGAGTRIGGVVDWVETSWGPADLDVAHCSTALALLHGVPAGMDFAERYAGAGGRPVASGADHLYWRLLDALSHAPDAEKVATPWRELGRADLTPGLLTERLENYVECLLDRLG